MDIEMGAEYVPLPPGLRSGWFRALIEMVSLCIVEVDNGSTNSAGDPAGDFDPDC